MRKMLEIVMSVISVKKKSVVYSNAEGLGENAAKDKGNVDKDKRFR